MALRRTQKRTPESKLDATPPWDTKAPREDVQVTTGPFDVADDPKDGLERLDLGALRVPVGEGLDVRIEVGDGGVVTSVLMVNENGQMQVGLFAAPRTEGIWDDVRHELRKSMTADGGTTQESDGEFGKELSGRVPVQGGVNPMRFVGIDGPKWFLRAMIVGPAALDEALAKPFRDSLRKMVVDRGPAPLPVREPVPLTLPREAQAQVEQAMAEQQTQQAQQTPQN